MKLPKLFSFIFLYRFPRHISGSKVKRHRHNPSQIPASQGVKSVRTEGVPFDFVSSDGWDPASKHKKTPDDKSGVQNQNRQELPGRAVVIFWKTYSEP